MRVLLTNPPWRDEVKGRYGVRAGSRWPFTLSHPGGYKPFPFLLAYATAYLRENGIEAELLDSIVSQHSYEHFFDAVKKSSSDIIVIETSTPSVNNDLMIAEKLYKEGYIVILTGPHASVFTDDLIKLDFVDTIIKGEYEKGLLKRIRSAKSGIYDYDLVEDLDSLPFPYRDPNTIFCYNDNPLGCRGKQIQMWASRGCPYRCIFCMWPPVMYNNRYRTRKPENVIIEVGDCIRRFGRNINIYFDDDTFNIGDERIQKIAEGIKKIGIDWAAMCRADTVSLETFTIMKESGCKGVKIGIESGCQRLLNTCQKNLNIQTVEKTVRHLKKIGMYVHLTFTFGLPGETKDTLRETINFGLRLHPDSVQFSITTPFPGTPYFKMAQEKGALITKDWNRYDGALESVIGDGLIETDLKIEDIKAAINEFDRTWRRVTCWQRRWRKLIRHIKGQPKKL